MLHDGPAVEPRPSTSVLLARAGDPWEVLMMRRPGGAEFAPNAFVFPGGSVHEEDRGFPDVSRAAGLRELFEEVGILLARRPGGGLARAADCARLSARLETGEPWTAALDECRLRPALDRLVLLTRWITPEQLRRRFDAHFYVARLPPGQTIRAQAGEVAGWRWVAPAEGLQDRDLVMVHATRRILESVSGEPDLARLIRNLRRRLPREPVRPRIIFEGDSWRIEEAPVRPLRSTQRQRSRQAS